MHSKLHVVSASAASIAAVALAGTLLGPQGQAEKPPLSLSVPDEAPNSYRAVETPTKAAPEKVLVAVPVTYSAPIHKEKVTKPKRHRHNRHRRHVPVRIQVLNAVKKPQVEVSQPPTAPTAPTSRPVVGRPKPVFQLDIRLAAGVYTQPPTI
jgi:hypothetical protein